MKAVILLAGKGRRIQNAIHNNHKALIPISGRPLIWYIIRNIQLAGVKEIVPVLGYNGNAIKDYLLNEFGTQVFHFVWNKDYEITNNLASLIKSYEKTKGDEFVVINGDMVFDYRILSKILQTNSAAVAVDIVDKNVLIDSPGTIIKGNRIYDLGRHIPIEDNGGYAIGIYKFSKDMIPVFFSEAASMIKENSNAGFHDPLRNIFDKREILACNTENMLWMDVDEKEDITRAENYISSLRGLYQ